MTLTRLSALAAATFLTMAAQPVLAADLTMQEEAAVQEAISSLSPWQVRVRALGVITNDSGSLRGDPAADLSYSDTVIPELDITYYFTDNIAAELILGTTYANIHGEGSLESFGKLGKTWLLPPTLTLQYHFTDFGAFKPYVGAGINYTIFYNQKGKALDKIDVENTFGLALQAGFDYMLDDHWGVNFDVKKLFLEADYEAKLGPATLRGKADLDPWLIGAGITYRF